MENPGAALSRKRWDGAGKEERAAQGEVLRKSVAKMTPAARRARAIKAAEARWSKEKKKH